MLFLFRFGKDLLIRGALQGPSSSGIDRSHKAAPMPSGVQEMNDGTYSGDGSRGGGSGQGPKDVPVDQIAEEASSSS